MLGVFSGKDFSVEAAAYVAEATNEGAEALLVRLAQLSLVQESRTGRYRLHPLLRDYARERLTDDHRYARLIEFFIHAVKTLGSTDFRPLEPDIENIVGALDETYQRGLSASQVQGIITLHRLVRSRGLYAALAVQLARAEHLSRDNEQQSNWAHILHYRAELNLAQEQAQPCPEEAVQIARSLSDRSVI